MLKKIGLLLTAILTGLCITMNVSADTNSQNNTQPDQDNVQNNQNNGNTDQSNNTDQNSNEQNHDQNTNQNQHHTDNTNQNNDHKKPRPRRVKYEKIVHRQNVNYYLRLNKGKQAVYASGAPKTSKSNMKPIYRTKKLAHHILHIKKIEQTKKGIWLRFITKHSHGWINLKSFQTGAHWINVPLIAQRPQLPSGCEMTAVTMMLRYAGVKVNKMQVAKATKRSSNPNKGFVGSPYSPSGWYVYPKGIAPVVKYYLHHAKNMTGASIKKLENQINHNHPVVVWIANVDGFPNHAVTMNGYDNKLIYYNDPWKNKRTSMSIKLFNYHRAKDDYRTLSY